MLLLFGFLLLLAAIAVAGAAFAHPEPRGIDRALEAIERSGQAQLDVAREEDRPFTDRVLEPMRARALTVGRRLMGAEQAEEVRRRLDVAGNPRGWTVDRVLSLKVMWAVGLPVLVLAYGALIGLALPTVLVAALVAVGAGFFVPDLYLVNKASHRADQVRRNLADAVDLLTISVEAGLGFDAAIHQVARNTSGPIGEELSRVLREMQLGMSRADALRAMAARSNVDELHTFVGSMIQADGFGIPISQALRVQSAELRVKRRQYAEERAQQVPVKIMVPLILFILPCLFVVVMGPAVLNALDAFGSG